MRRFEFSLDRLLKLKQQLEKIAELEVSRAQDALSRARASLQELHDQLKRVAEHITASVGRAVPPHQWANAAIVSDKIEHSIQAAKRTVVEAQNRLEVTNQERAQLATEVEALTALRKQRWDTWRHESLKADQLRLDEVGLRRWQAAREEAAEPPELS